PSLFLHLISSLRLATEQEVGSDENSSSDKNQNIEMNRSHIGRRQRTRVHASRERIRPYEESGKRLQGYSPVLSERRTEFPETHIRRACRGWKSSWPLVFGG